METKYIYFLFCVVLFFGCCEMSLKFTDRPIEVTKLGSPHSKHHTSRGFLDHDPTVGKKRFNRTYLPDVLLTCSAFDLVVRVKPSFYGFGADESELQLGQSCRSNGVLRPYGDLLFAYPLTACGSRKESTSDFLVYKFTLHYEPSTERFPSGAPRFDVVIECRYQRYNYVHQLAVKPTWTTVHLRKNLRVHPNEFQIHLMDDSWSNPVKNQVFRLGQKVNVQVSAPHLPTRRRLYINNCFALPDNNSSISHKYTIIGNLGCMLDSKRDPGGASRFISRANKTLRFSFKAFQFIFDPESEISIYCKLFASSKEPSPAQKSCSYRNKRWKALLGHDSICQCCDSQCGSSKSKRISIEGSVRSALLVADQPLVIEEGLLRVSRMTQPQHVHSGDILWPNDDVPKNDKDYGGKSVILRGKLGHTVGKVDLEKKKSEEAGLKGFIKDGYDVVEEEFKGLGAKHAIQDDEIKREELRDQVRMEHMLVSQVPEQKLVPKLNTEGDEGNKHTNGTKEAAKTQSSDVQNNYEQVDDKELAWYFSWT
ncbi:zona pellucida sperm-binding protein 3 isoform X1 [Corythoichthys intestinalis]|uniref:zona pellucida sperm-binding protein 3 isoform X1 n=1 Tax=Corythoichthys intestinalis TaxID=161448 RepID=UPI0025A612D7|nr:zona pellucida sperm-binding protein 3 isoform X1 [Corythoichthys intestinalis]